MKAYVPLRVFVEATALKVTPLLPLTPANSFSPTPLGAVPAMLTVPASRKKPRGAFRMRLIEMRYGIGTTPWASRVPATFGVPVPGVYGVKRERQSWLPALAEFVKMPLTEKAASRNFVPFGERRGSPAASVGSRKQTVIFTELNAASAPVEWST